MTAPMLSDAERNDLVRRMARLSRPMDPEPTGVQPRVRPLDGIKAVLFDVYGTLLVSAAGDVGSGAAPDSRAVAEALDAASFSVLSPSTGPRGVVLLDHGIRRAHEAARRQGVDVPEVDIEAVWSEVLGTLASEGLITGSPNPALVRQLAVEYECRVNPTWPMPDMAVVLADLRKAGLVLGIVSNAQFFTPLVFEALHPGGLPALGVDADLCLWSWKLGVAKPSPRLFEHALRRLRDRHAIRPAETLMVGNDAGKDVEPAARLGCRTALFAGDRRSLRGSELAKRKADVVVTALLQLADAMRPA